MTRTEALELVVTFGTDHEGLTGSIVFVEGSCAAVPAVEFEAAALTAVVKQCPLLRSQLHPLYRL